MTLRLSDPSRYDPITLAKAASQTLQRGGVTTLPKNPSNNSFNDAKVHAKQAALAARLVIEKGGNCSAPTGEYKDLIDKAVAEADKILEDFNKNPVT